jgi:hypothetical protein
MTTKTESIIAYVRLHPGSTAKDVAAGLKQDLSSVAALLSIAHQADIVVSQSIWVKSSPCCKRPVHHYSARGVL